MKRRHGLTPMERIERRRHITPAGCWETSYDPRHVYPQLKVAGKKLMIHRLVYEALVGPIPLGLFICHRCDNPRCHNPDHLFAGDAVTNMQDMAAKGRAGNGVPRSINYTSVEAISHLPQVEIAKQLGASQASVSKILRGAGLSRGRQTSFNKARVGTAHGRALVTEDQVRAIRIDPRSAKLIAVDYSLSESAAHAIKTRRTWKHVE